MIAYHYRFVTNKGKPTNYHGVAWATDMLDLFWIIDSHGDPYRCEIAPLKRSGSFCVLEVQLNEHEHEYQEHEIHLDTDGLKWAKPKWPKNISL